MFNKYKLIVESDIQKLSLKYNEAVIQADTYKQSINKLEKFLKLKNHEKKRLRKIRKEQNKIITILDKEKKLYKKTLEKMMKQKQNLQAILNKLKITKTIHNKKRGNRKINSMQVRQLGSSYQKVKIAKYKGRKVSPPITKYRVIKKFGTYIDPMYNLKIFNDSVVLEPLIANSKVRAVKSGKVILAKDTATLNKVVIIKHKDGTHTVYAHLDKIVPRIEGRFIKKGYVIGRVNTELIFQVTAKNGRYINPSRYIKLK